MSRRVVVTGVGPVTSIGVGAGEFLEGQHAGRSGVTLITSFDTSRVKVKFGGEVRFDLAGQFDRKEVRRLDRFSQFALLGTKLALEDAGLAESEVAGEHTGVIIGSGIGGMITWQEQSRIWVEKGEDRLSPWFVPMMMENAASANVSMRYGVRGPSFSVVSACSTGSGNIGEAYRVLQRGEAGIMIAGGAEATITAMCIGAFDNMGALSRRNEDPARASRPFTKSRDGFVMGEGSGILILEEYDRARQRGARIYAEIVGYSTMSDAHHITAPTPGGTGLKRAMERALAEGGIPADKVGYINAHGTSTPLNDLSETRAIQAVFGENTRVPVSGTKSMIGHLFGGAGATGAIATVQAIHHGVLPPTINHDDPDPELTLDYIPNEARESKIDFALSNIAAFGGHNTVLAYRRV
jgi:3-oxoacyl-[acyl-carrier-protein] synthase II